MLDLGDMSAFEDSIVDRIKDRHLTRDLMEKYQVDLTGFIKRVKRGAVWADMSSGKTVCTLTAILDMIDELEACKVLVVAPLRVAQKVWADEIQAWAHTRGLRFMFLSGTAAQMERKIFKHMANVDVWGLSCDSVKALATLYSGTRHPWDWVVIDESSRFKNGSATRTKSLSLLTIHPLRVTELTGTPTPNGIKDIWSQIYMLDRGERLGRSMAEFKRLFFLSKSGEPCNKPDDLGIARIHKKIADIVYILQPEDFKSERKPLYNNIMLSLGTDLLKAYKKFQKDYVLSLIEGGTITAQNAVSLSRKSLQFASGAIYDTEHVAQYVHDIKIEALAEIVEDNPGKPLLIAYGFKHEVERIQKRFPQAELFGKDPTQQDRWNRGEIPMLLAHSRSAGHGLNLQFGGHILVWFSFDYNLEEYQQLNKRLPRKGQINQVIIHHLVMEKTIDVLIINSLGAKDGVQQSFQRDLKKYIKEILKSLHREDVEVIL